MALAITSITPATGPQTGGTAIVIAGTELEDVTEVWIANKKVTFTVTGTSPTAEIHTTTPNAPAAGTATVRLVTAAEYIDEVGGFNYTAVANEQLATALARKFRVEVDTVDSEASPDWAAIRGINSLTPGINTTTQDDTDFDSDGWASTVKTMLGWQLTIGLLRKYGVGTGVYDPGQEKVRAAADKFGGEGLVHLRWYDREGSDEAYEGWASVQWEPAGGDATALENINVTLLGQGKRIMITNPAA